MSTLTSAIKTLSLWELLAGLRVTLRNLFVKKITIQYPEEKTPQSPRFRGCMRCAVIRTARSAASPASSARRSARRRPSRSSRTLRLTGPGARPATTSISSSASICGFCEEACPVDAIVETRIFEYHMEQRGENIMTKDKLLAIGDKYEAMIAADRLADSRYR